MWSCEHKQKLKESIDVLCVYIKACESNSVYYLLFIDKNQYQSTQHVLCQIVILGFLTSYTDVEVNLWLCEMQQAFK